MDLQGLADRGQGRLRLVALSRWGRRSPGNWTPAGKTSASRDVIEVELAVLEPDSRVVWRIEFVSDDPAYTGTMTMTWALTEVEGGTEVSVRADDVPAGISASDHEAGIASSLANLAAHVEPPDG